MHQTGLVQVNAGKGRGLFLPVELIWVQTLMYKTRCTHTPINNPKTLPRIMCVKSWCKRIDCIAQPLEQGLIEQ